MCMFMCVCVGTARSVDYAPGTARHGQPVCNTKPNDLTRGLWKGYPWKVGRSVFDLELGAVWHCQCVIVVRACW